MFPNILDDDKDKREAAITLEAVNVYLRGHQPCEDSPVYGMKEKSVAKRVQRFLKAAKHYWDLEASIQKAQDLDDAAEATGFLSESRDQLAAADDPDDLRAFENNFGLEGNRKTPMHPVMTTTLTTL